MSLASPVGTITPTFVNSAPVSPSVITAAFYAPIAAPSQVVETAKNAPKTPPLQDARKRSNLAPDGDLAQAGVLLHISEQGRSEAAKAAAHPDIEDSELPAPVKQMLMQIRSIQMHPLATAQKAPRTAEDPESHAPQPAPKPEEAGEGPGNPLLEARLQLAKLVGTLGLSAEQATQVFALMNAPV